MSQLFARARRRAGPGRGSDGLPFAALRVPCDARVPGPVAELAAFAALSTLRHLQRVRSRRRAAACGAARRRRKRGVRSLSAAPIRPAQAPPAALPATVSVFDVRPRPRTATGHPGRDQRASEAPSSTGFGARARSALRDLTRRACSTTVSAANGGSARRGHGPEQRRAVVAQRRPPQLSAGPCPGAPLPRHRQQSGNSMTATGRNRQVHSSSCRQSRQCAVRQVAAWAPRVTHRANRPPLPPRSRRSAASAAVLSSRCNCMRLNAPLA